MKKKFIVPFQEKVGIKQNKEGSWRAINNRQVILLSVRTNMSLVSSQLAPNIEFQLDQPFLFWLVNLKVEKQFLKPLLTMVAFG